MVGRLADRLIGTSVDADEVLVEVKKTGELTNFRLVMKSNHGSVQVSVGPM